MLPENLVLDESATPEDFDSLLELLDTRFKTEHEQTSLEHLSLTPEGIVRTPSGDLRVTRDFLEQCAKAIRMPLAYAYTVTPALFCENFAQRVTHAAGPVTVCRVGDIATGLVLDGKSRYRPAYSRDALSVIAKRPDLTFRRATVSYSGLLVEVVQPGNVVEPAVGDVIELGVALSNSETGDRHLKASAYAYRLVCTNGAVMSDSLGTARWPSDIRMTAAGSLRAFTRELESLCEKSGQTRHIYESVQDRHLTDVELVNLLRRVSYALPRGLSANNVVGIDQHERAEMQEQIRARGPQIQPVVTRWNVYDTHNRITHAAHGQGLRTRRALQEIGGDLLFRASRWQMASSMN